jgi:hypothetical protein
MTGTTVENLGSNNFSSSSQASTTVLTETLGSTELSISTIFSDTKTTHNFQPSTINSTESSLQQLTVLTSETAMTTNINLTTQLNSLSEISSSFLPESSTSTLPQTSKGYAVSSSVLDSYTNVSSEKTQGSISQYSTDNLSNINTLNITIFKTTAEPIANVSTEQTTLPNNGSETIANVSTQKISSLDPLRDTSLDQASLSSSSSESVPSESTFNQWISSSNYSGSNLYSLSVTQVSTELQTTKSAITTSTDFSSRNSDAVPISSAFYLFSEITSTTPPDLKSSPLTSEPSTQQNLVRSLGTEQVINTLLGFI